MASARLARCLQIANLLQSRIGHSAVQLACQMEVSRRTVFRDLRLLQEAGAPIQYVPARGGYIMETGFRASLGALASNDLLLMLLAAHTSQLASSPQCGRIVEAAIARIVAQLPAGLNRQASAILSACTMAPGNAPSFECDTLCLKMIAAIGQRLCVRISVCPEGDVGPRLYTKLASCRLLAAKDHWEVIGRSSWHRRTCRFDMRTIRDLEVLEDVYPAPSAGRRMSLQR